MTRRVIAVMAASLLAMVATACSQGGGAGLPPPPPGFPGAPPGGSSQSYTGQPARLQVVIPASIVRRWPRLFPVAMASDGTEAIIRMANHSGGYRIYEEFIRRPYSTSTPIVIEFEVVGQMGYEVSVVVHGSGLKAAGMVQAIAVGDHETVPVEVPVEPPAYQLSVPSVVYGGGDVRQFVARNDHPMYGSGNVGILIGMEPWAVNGKDGLWRQPGNDPNRGGFGAIVWGGSSVVGSRSFPHVEVDTLLYWQVVVCVKPMYTGGSGYCYYDPDIESGEPLETTTLAAGRP